MNGGWIFCALLATAWPAHGTDAAAPLALERKIMLGRVDGRIDHLAVDLTRQRLFVAEVGNKTVGVVDLRESKVLTRLSSFKEPQGLAYHAATEMLCVASGGDGTVRLFSGADLTPRGEIDLGDDADNIRIDAKGDRLSVGYGKGALAVIEPTRPARIADIKLDAHPEGFQLDRSGKFAYVNLPWARKIAIVDLAQGKITSSMRLNQLANLPMAVDHDGQRM
jgi:DNA-binding beta-propeller fold protein YncE